ncbi:hypothetical protein [Neptunomonas phycophila]|uniref:hypothetical protein n=1 Tax=Neptunomonas phycophila TaxID=1572645 RepID=UPI0015B7C492|nr:hypothetical protein [Neptunomonas phycophila]QLE98180.1 hypothetical protein FLM49_11330 [Neptunomonas phycophila]
MNIAEVTNPVHITSLAEAEKLRSAISAGTINASATVSGSNTFVWTEREKERLAAVLQSVRDAEAKSV